MLKHYSTSAVVLAMLMLAGCSQPPKPAAETDTTDTSAKEASGPPQPVSGKTAYWEIYKSARTWATDIQPLRIESKDIPGVKNDGGKAAMWAVTFGSPSQHAMRTYTYAIVAHAPDIYKGVTIGRSLDWNGPTRDAMPFKVSEAVDSDAAYQAASKDADAWLKKHPDKEASLTLGNAYRFPAPVWFVLWGDKKLGYAAFVNAENGNVVKDGGKKPAS
ncbi:MAG: hypothetical protein JO211_04570 [Acidobacteriaceae bacterium]|nr:hypothetical protein [Acidobacteriaceae bacterium]